MRTTTSLQLWIRSGGCSELHPSVPRRGGYQNALAWMEDFGSIVAAGVESTGSYGAALTRSLKEAGVRIVEINQPHAHTKSRRGKDDAIDAEAAARKVLSGEAKGAAKDTSGIVESIRQFMVARDGAVKARTAALGQLGDLIITAPAPLREKLARRVSRARQHSATGSGRPLLDHVQCGRRRLP